MSTKVIIKDLKNLEDLFDFSNLDENHEIFSKKKEKVNGKFKIETHKNVCIDDFVCLKSKAYSFKYGDDSKKKLETYFKSQTKHIKIEEIKKCLDGLDNINHVSSILSFIPFFPDFRIETRYILKKPQRK